MPNFTKQAIKQTFLQLLDERPLSAITVKDIVENCGINRNSFYYHFRDIHALLEEIVTEEADRIIAAYPTIDSLEMALGAAVDFAETHRRAVLHIYRSIDRALFEQYLWKVSGHVVASFAHSALGDAQMDEDDRAVFLHLFECQCFGLVMAWLNDGMREDVHGRICRLCELQRSFLEGMGLYARP